MPSERITVVHTLKKQQTLWPLYGWGSTASRLEPLWRGSFLSLSLQKFLVLIFGPRKAERLSRPWSHPVVLNMGSLYRQSSALNCRVKLQ